MSLEEIIYQMEFFHKWTKEYSKIVAGEYLKFLDLFSKNKNTSPSNDVDRFWHQHILNTINYRNFCNNRYGRFIDHHPENGYDQKARSMRISNTVKNIEKPSERIWKNNLGKIKIKIIYTFDNDTFSGKFPKKNSGMEYDNKIFLIETNSIENIKSLISKKTNHNKLAIKFYKNINEYYEKKQELKELNDDCLCILEEMSHSGYC